MSESKAGSKSCSSPDDYYEDDLVTLLQYPLGDPVEKSYCSDFFGQWSTSSMAFLPCTSVGASRTTTGVSVSAGADAFSENGFLSGSDCVPASCDSRNTDAKERVGNGSSVLRASSAEGALALGAERAAGLVSLSGRDTFNKVKTSMQPPAGFLLTPVPTSNAVGQLDQPLRLRSLASPGAIAGKLPLQLPQGKLSSPSKLPHLSPSCEASASSSLASAGMGAMSHSTSFTSSRSRRLTEVPVHMPSSQDSRSSRITEEMSVQRASDHTSSASNRGHASIAQVSGLMPARFSSLEIEGGNQLTPVLGRSESVRISSSGRSLSGTTLSTREASSYSGKRKLEDSESQSEDVEDESSMDVKQPRKSSSSKRNRAAEVHNLSERNRRNRINEKLKALQDLIPNSSKTDKASVLDEAIEYMKTLQMQLQMVSLRSGLSVSPMMMPLGMPHLQMAPLHPVGLGMPIGHPGMGMGLHMSMGMGMMDMPQGLMARPPQSIQAYPNYLSMPFQGRTGSHECSLDSTNFGSMPSQLMPSTQSSSQIPAPMHPGFPSFSSTHLRQQHEQWQASGHYSEPGKHSHEQVGKED